MLDWCAVLQEGGDFGKVRVIGGGLLPLVFGGERERGGFVDNEHVQGTGFVWVGVLGEALLGVDLGCEEGYGDGLYDAFAGVPEETL